MEKYINNNIDLCRTELDIQFSRNKLKKGIKLLKNNKLFGFDCVTNEIIKLCNSALHSGILLLFNTILEHNLYPNTFKQDILGPLFKSGSKSKHSNFHNICISSCPEKLINSLLKFNLDSKYCKEFTKI